MTKHNWNLTECGMWLEGPPGRTSTEPLPFEFYCPACVGVLTDRYLAGREP